MTTETAPRRITARSIGGGVTAAIIGFLLGVGLAEVSHLAKWSRAVPYTVVGIVALWVASVGVDRLITWIRRGR